MNTDGSNRLAVLAAEITDADGRCRSSAAETAAAALEAGRALNEAKALVKHGQWASWLQGHCQMSDRTARRYMQLARAGLDIGHVADLGIRAAAEAIAKRDLILDQAVDAAIWILRCLGCEPPPQDVADFVGRSDLEQFASAMISACDARMVS
jgi:hypothetical protein